MDDEAQPGDRRPAPRDAVDLAPVAGLVRGKAARRIGHDADPVSGRDQRACLLLDPRVVGVGVAHEHDDVVLSHRSARPRPRCRPSPPASGRGRSARRSARSRTGRSRARRARAPAIVAVADQRAVDAVADDVAQPADVARHDPPAAGDRLDRDEAERLGQRRHEHDVVRGDQRRDLGRVEVAEPRADERVGKPLGDLVALARVPAAEVEDAPLRRPWRGGEARQVHAGRDDLRDGRRARGGGRRCPSEFVSSRSARRATCCASQRIGAGKVAPVAHVAAVRVDDEGDAAHPGHDQPDEAGGDQHVRLDAPNRPGAERVEEQERVDQQAREPRPARPHDPQPGDARSPARGRRCRRSAARASARCA